MRAFIAVVATTVSLSLSADGLHAQRAPIRYGVLAGANLSSIHDVDEGLSEAGDALMVNQRRAGGQAALYATVPVSSRFSLQPEVHYIQKGGKASVTLNSIAASPLETGRMSIGLRLSYVEIPLLARFDLADRSRAWRPFVMAGPSFSLKTGCTASTEVGSFKVSGSCSDDASLPEESATVANTASNPDPVRDTDIGAIAGVGVQGALLNRQFSVQVRYMQGLRSIASEQIASASPKNRGFALVLGLGF